MSSESVTPQAGSYSDGIREGRAPMPGYYKVLFAGLVIWAVFFSAYYLFSGWSSSGEFEEKMATHQESLP